MRIFLTGGTGFIGRQVLRRLLAAGHEVCCLGRPRQMSAGERWHDCRLEESDRLAEILAEFQPEACLHLAWYAEPGRYLESPLNLELVGQSVRLCELAAAAGCRRFVGAGSCSEYDVRGGLLGEESPTVPSTLYAAAKLSAGQLCRVVAERNAMSFAWGRIFYVYGPGEDGRRFVPTAIRSLLAGEPFAITSGRMIRDYLSVHDVAAAFVRLTESVAEGVYNVCSGEPITIRTLAETIASRCHAEGLLTFGGTPRSSFDPPLVLGTNARLRALGWEPTIDLATGLDEAIESCRDTCRSGTAASRDPHR